MAKYLMIAWFVAWIFTFGTAEILVGPQDTEAEIGKAVELYCKGTLSDVEWQHRSIGEPYPELVYKEGFFYNGYKHRFNTSRTNDGRSVLIIRNVEPSDAGTFTCLEDSETPSRRPAELIVFENFPSDESCTGKYTCKPVCNELDLSCEMKARGNYIPSLEWMDSDGRQFKSMQLMANDITISTIKLKTDPYAAVSLTCRLKYLGIPLNSKYSWTYSTSVATDMESLFKPHYQLNEVPPSQPVSMMVVVVAIVATFVVTSLITAAFAAVVFVLIYKKKNTERKDEQKLQRHISGESSESSNDATQHLLGVEIVKDENLVDKNFVPCTNMNSGKAIYGVSAIDDEVFIMTKDGRVVEVFDLHKGTFKRYWPIGGLINPNDMAACPIVKKIFICDWKKAAEDKEIFCFDINGNPVGQSWVSEYEKGRISITKKSKVIIAESWHNTIKEYTSSGALQKTIKAGEDKLHLWHAVKMSDGNFVASFGDSRDGREDPQICIIDENGNFLMSLRNGPDLTLSVPRSLAVDKLGNIYVSDQFNGRITVLKPDLEFKGFLDTTSDEQELRGPMRICVHEYDNESWLLVADNVKVGNTWRNGRLAAWNLQSCSLKGFPEN